MPIFVEIGLILFIVTIVTSIARLLKQPLVVGYILSGILLGPYVLDLMHATEYIELFSKLGIAMLLFIVGLNLKPEIIREVGKVSLVTGIGQIVFTSLVGFFIMKLLGFDNTSSLYGAVALTFSSTIIILKLLGDKGDLRKLYGKISVGFLLVQDLVATLILLLISIWGSASVDNTGGDMGMKIFSLIAKGLLAFSVVYLLGRYLLPKLSKFLAGSQEYLFMFAITWGIGISAIFYSFGFSLEIGALIAGIAISTSIFAQEISSKMKPLQDFFILQFFVLLGAQMVLSEFSVIFWPAIILSVFVLVGNPIIVMVLMNLLGFKSHTGFLAGLTVAQISEFSLILMALGLHFGHFDSTVVSLITLVGIITISGSTYLILYGDKLYEKVRPVLKFFEFRKLKNPISETETSDDYNIIIFGYDRTGYDFLELAKKIGKKFLIVDFDPSAIHKLKKENIPYRFGDAGDIDFLEEINMRNAEAIISTIPDFNTNLGLVSYYRNHNPEGIIMVLAHNIKNAKELYNRGASMVIMPHYEGAKYASHLLEKYQLDKDAFNEKKEKHLEYLTERARLTS